MKSLICLLFSLITSGAVLAQSPTVKVEAQTDDRLPKSTGKLVRVPVVVEVAPTNSGRVSKKASSKINKRPDKPLGTPIKVPVRVEKAPTNSAYTPVNIRSQIDSMPGKSVSAPIRVPVRITKYT